GGGRGPRGPRSVPPGRHGLGRAGDGSVRSRQPRIRRLRGPGGGEHALRDINGRRRPGVDPRAPPGREPVAGPEAPPPRRPRRRARRAPGADARYAAMNRSRIRHRRTQTKQDGYRWEWKGSAVNREPARTCWEGVRLALQEP